MKSIYERIKEVEAKITHVKGTYEAILAIHTQVDRKKKSLEGDLRILEDEKLKIQQGQLDIFDELPF